MRVDEINNKRIWEDFVLSFHPNNFLASWAWGDFNETLGYPAFRLGLYEDEELVGTCLAIKVLWRLGTYLLCPSGPLLREIKKGPLFYFLEHLKERAKKERCLFLRVRPLIEASKETKTLFDQFGFKDAPTHVHAETTWLLDLKPKEEILLANMRKTTRYLIRQAEKLGVKISWGTNLANLHKFEELLEETAKRKHFVPFSRDYLRSELEVFKKSKAIKIVQAVYKGEVLASAIIVFYGDSAFYHHGASLQEKVPASYLLQWEAIKLAKKIGCRYYNFWGVAPKPDPKHPWAGLTLFKQGFGGFRKNYLHAQDLPLSARYTLSYWFEKVRQRLRGFSY